MLVVIFLPVDWMKKIFFIKIQGVERVGVGRAEKNTVDYIMKH